MRRITSLSAAVVLFLTAALAIGVTAARKPASPLADLPSGKVQLMSAGALAFGPDGILFVGDSVGGAVVAIDTGDRKAAASAAKINVQGIDEKIAALVGVTPDQIMINDVKVNPISKNVYLSASRGRGPDAMPLIVRVDASGKVTALSLDNAKHASVSLVDAPASDTTARQNPRMQTITDMNYVNGNLIVAGLSNEEWSSALRSIPFPFKDAAKGATLQIWHSSHGRYETAGSGADVRSLHDFRPAVHSGGLHLHAAGEDSGQRAEARRQVKGVEIADLGAGNQPLDMVPYKKDGHDYILIANTARGVMKLKADNLETYPAIDSPTQDRRGRRSLRHDVQILQNVQHLAQLDDSNAVIITGKTTAASPVRPGPPAGPLNLQTIALP